MENLIKDLLKDKEINEYVQKNNITDKGILNDLSEFVLKQGIDLECLKCNKNGTCNNETPFSKCVLDYYNDHTHARLVKCPYEPKGSLVTFFDEKIPSDVYINDNRAVLFKELRNFKDQIKNQKASKGVFIYGGYGQGKSVILYNFAREIIKEGKKVIYVYYPDLVRKIKSSIGTSEFESMLLDLKKTDILMLDDLGGENNSPFIRDEVLGPILQYRMNNILPTFATSNYSIDELITHFAETSNESDGLKAGRIIERIRSLMIPVELKDKDYRN